MSLHGIAGMIVYFITFKSSIYKRNECLDDLFSFYKLASYIVAYIIAANFCIMVMKQLVFYYFVDNFDIYTSFMEIFDIFRSKTFETSRNE